ncbi:hypothetical protein WG68_06945 [Arsukibacterium ikkense]|uniref:Uncharacterized protein n=1 Tax=Arsukibacterium ikkense TaxID=336831 RepID=A0A0M2V8V5_9GAMM|nr:hypothetical protein [Arsukibacterium ikkense]KKO46090.1 hypothetical protein WG68_06945 [Arsukibacterium ikkense]
MLIKGYWFDYASFDSKNTSASLTDGNQNAGWNPVLVATECLSERASANELLWRAKAGVAAKRF